MPPKRPTAGELRTIRDFLAELPPASAHQAALPPDLQRLYSPRSHDKAIDPDRALVIGNRGAGKSLWASALAHPEARVQVAKAYPRLRLDRTEVVLGFHEDAGKDDSPAPSPAQLAALLKAGHTSEAIWRAVLLRALGSRTGLELPDLLSDTLPWIDAHIEAVEAGLRRADKALTSSGARFLLVFDALDRIGSDWGIIRTLTTGILRFALDMRGYRSLRAKLFLRTDQGRDEALFRFPDASKLRAEAVDLTWRSVDLYGLIYSLMWANKASGSAFRQLVHRAVPELRIDESSNEAPKSGLVLIDGLPDTLKYEEGVQEAVFSALAGLYMGPDRRRGRTYTWLHNHLADAFGETSPRSFQIALQSAAESVQGTLPTVIDHHGIRTGVQKASGVRLDQLREDYDWITDVIADLAELEVPCVPSKFTGRWNEKSTVARIRAKVRSGHLLGPVELEGGHLVPEVALLHALRNIGVIEFRSGDKINMPDIFRVAARIKRRGGLKPPGRA